MKKVVVIILLAVLSFSFIGCAHSKSINGQEYEPYGVFSLDEKCDSIKYRVSVGNVVWSCVAFQTIAVPVILCGWYLWEPVKHK